MVNSITRAIDTNENPYPIYNFIPGRTKIIQIFNPDGTAYVIPAGATVNGRVISIFRSLVANFETAVVDASKGMVSLKLPNNDRVTRAVKKFNFYSLEIIATISNQVVTKSLPLSSIEIDVDPGSYPLVSTALSQVLPGSGVSSPGSSLTPVQPTILYVQDQVWVDNTGKKVQVTIEKQPDGKQLFKLTEVV
jgi:hypothetical protein